ncbi:MAG TPA: TlpA disulfide reductase family protein [Burkholderiaceae bacterium]|nr:TlpA disulfide reductase family protein [Burkholderiaceae bacterium]
MSADPQDPGPAHGLGEPARERAMPLGRRRVLGATAALAVGAGVAVQWLGGKPHGDAASGPPWSLSFDRPDGSRLSMAPYLGQPVVLNFWATWCPPCLREMPALDRFQREFRSIGWRVVGIAADKPQAVQAFLARVPVSFDIALAGFAGIELSRQLGNEAGGLPFTVIYERSGRIVRSHAGETRFEQLVSWVSGIS